MDRRRLHVRFLSRGARAFAIAMVMHLLVGVSGGEAQDARETPQIRGTPASCEGASWTAEMKRLVQQGAFVDVHMVALSLFVSCPEHPETNAWRLLDAYALLELDETARGRAILLSVASSGSRLGPAAWTLLGWSQLEDYEPALFRRVIEHLDAESRARLVSLSVVDDRESFLRETARLSPRLREHARSLHDELLDRQDRSPWVAGILSAVVPGLGQLYAGSLESGAIAFVLNAVFIAATVELAIHELYVTASAAGLVSSVFYLGNILNAVDLVNRRNEVSSAPERVRLERLLLPHGVGTLR